MASSVYIGRWRDFSHPGVLGDVITLDVRWGGYLLAALSTFVGFVGTAAWSLLAFWLHQIRASRVRRDAVYFQQQAIYRNSGSATAGLWSMLCICWAWRKPRGSQNRVQGLKGRSVVAALPPLVVFLAFTAAGVFIGEIAGKSYASNNVLLKSGRCGTALYNRTTVAGQRAMSQRVLNDTISARAYALDCYGSNAYNPTSSVCGQFPVATLQYKSSIVACPFGKDPNGEDLCLPDQNSAYELSTPAMDSSDVFGINAAPENRVTVHKRLTCAPLHAQNYVTTADDYYFFNMGSINNITNYTYNYPIHAALDNFGYQMTAVYAGDSAYQPVEALQLTTGDVSVYFQSPNSVGYLAPVDDLWFAAHDERDLNTDSGQKLATVYYPDKYVSVMGCVDQYQICNPTTDPPSCTIVGSQANMVAAIYQIGLNSYQTATALRMLAAITLTSTFSSVNLLGALALEARNNVIGLLSTGLLSNQWQIEVEKWFQTSLAKFQNYIPNYVTNAEDLGPYGYVVRVTDTGNPIDEAALALCSQQRTRNVGSYQTFSAVGLLIVVCVGGAIILLSWIVEPIVGLVRSLSKRTVGDPNHEYKEVARVADKTLQLQRMALMYNGNEEAWEKVLGDYPVTKAHTTFTPPQRRVINGVVDYRYGEADGLLQQTPELSTESSTVHIGKHPEY